MGRRFEPTMIVNFKEFDESKVAGVGTETLFEAFQRKYPKYAENFKDRFEKATSMPFEWKSINLPNLYKYIQYLKLCGLADNSVNQYGIKMMSVLNLYRDIHPEIPDSARLSSVLNTDLDESYEVSLEDSEVDRLYGYLAYLLKKRGPEKQHTRRDPIQHDIEVLSFFLLSVDTGSRLSDVKRITWRNISQNIDSDGNSIYVLTHTTGKRGIKATVPIAKDARVVPLLQNLPKLTVSDRECNKRIKIICRDAGLNRVIKRRHAGKDETMELWKSVHFHLARKSFVTQNIENGANIIDVMQFVAHTNPKQTMKYNCKGPSFDSEVLRKQSRNKELVDAYSR